jgi:hypothetical protein
MKTTLWSNGVRGFYKEWHSVGNGPLSGAQDINLSLGRWLKTSIGSSCTYTIINGQPGQWYFLRIEQGLGGPFSIAFTNVDWGDFPPPDHTRAPNEGDWTLVGFYCDADGNYSGVYGEAFLSVWF